MNIRNLEELKRDKYFKSGQIKIIHVCPPRE